MNVEEFAGGDPNKLWDLLSVEILPAKSDFCYLGGYCFLPIDYLLVWLYCFLASGIRGVFYFDFYYCLLLVILGVVDPTLKPPNNPLTDDYVVDYICLLVLNNPVVVVEAGILLVLVFDCFFYNSASLLLLAANNEAAPLAAPNKLVGAVCFLGYYFLFSVLLVCYIFYVGLFCWVDKLLN